eukprot:m.340816 g.340816  ORF g.340816 m.340816 type:complete len:535 (+) comp19574_c0_seq1:70-1674(+)
MLSNSEFEESDAQNVASAAEQKKLPRQLGEGGVSHDTSLGDSFLGPFCGSSIGDMEGIMRAPENTKKIDPLPEKTLSKDIPEEEDKTVIKELSESGVENSDKSIREKQPRLHETLVIWEHQRWAMSQWAFTHKMLPGLDPPPWTDRIGNICTKETYDDLMDNYGTLREDHIQRFGDLLKLRKESGSSSTQSMHNTDDNCNPEDIEQNEKISNTNAEMKSSQVILEGDEPKLNKIWNVPKWIWVADSEWTAGPWQYSFSFQGTWKPTLERSHFVRRRRWTRERCKLQTRESKKKLAGVRFSEDTVLERKLPNHVWKTCVASKNGPKWILKYRQDCLNCNIPNGAALAAFLVATGSAPFYRQSVAREILAGVTPFPDTTEGNVVKLMSTSPAEDEDQSVWDTCFDDLLEILEETGSLEEACQEILQRVAMLSVNRNFRNRLSDTPDTQDSRKEVLDISGSLLDFIDSSLDYLDPPPPQASSPSMLEQEDNKIGEGQGVTNQEQEETTAVSKPEECTGVTNLEGNYATKLEQENTQD